MNPDLELQIRKLTVPQLEILKVLASSPEAVSSNQEIMTTTGTPSCTYGAFLASLRKVKVENIPLLLQAGVDPDKGTRWQINEGLVTKFDLRSLLTSMGV